MELGKNKIRQYLICHENEYTEGIDTCLSPLPITPVLPIKGTENSVDAFAYEDWTGTIHKMPRVIKKSVEFEATCVGEDNLDKVNELIFDKIKTYGSDIFYLNFYFPSVGWYFSKVYLGNTREPVAEYIDMKDGSTTVTKMKMSFIEVDGIKLNL